MGQLADSAPRVSWTPLVWFAGFLLLCYWPVLGGLLGAWQSDDDMAHGPFAAIVAGYIIWQRRDEVLRLEPKGTLWGGVLLVVAAVQLIIASLGAELFLARTAFLLSLVGTLIYFRGTQVLRVLAFPLVMLLFMIPLPGVLYKEITFPLQMIASRLAERSLDMLGHTVLREGNILELAGQQLSVVEACSGIRSLLSLSFLSLVYSYFMDSQVWMRWLLLAATIPVAIVANAGRIVVTGVIGSYNQELAQGMLHAASGWIIALIAFGFLILIQRLSNTVYARINALRSTV